MVWRESWLYKTCFHYNSTDSIMLFILLFPSNEFYPNFWATLASTAASQPSFNLLSIGSHSFTDGLKLSSWFPFQVERKRCLKLRLIWIEYWMLIGWWRYFCYVSEECRILNQHNIWAVVLICGGLSSLLHDTWYLPWCLILSLIVK